MVYFTDLLADDSESIPPEPQASCTAVATFGLCQSLSPSLFFLSHPSSVRTTVLTGWALRWGKGQMSVAKPH